MQSIFPSIPRSLLTPLCISLFEITFYVTFASSEYFFCGKMSDLLMRSQGHTYSFVPIWLRIFFF